MGKDYVCNKCGYNWTSRKGQGEPAYCPRCSSKRISQEIEEIDDSKNKTNSTCDYCGRNVKITEMKGYCQWKGFLGRHCLSSDMGSLSKKHLCKKCADECRYCNKIFCPKHIDTHKC